MENIFLLLASRLAGRTAESKFKRYMIGRTGCTALLLWGDPSFYIYKTNDKEPVYFYEQEMTDVSFGMIVVNMRELYTLDKAESILMHYMNSIRKPFCIACNVGMETERDGQSLRVNDYWQDANGIDWKVRGESDGKILSVLYVKNISSSPVNEHDAFLNGFRFSTSA